MTALPQRRLAALHTGVEISRPESAAVVGQKHNHSVFTKLMVGQKHFQSPDVLVDIGTHGKKPNQLLFDLRCNVRQVTANRTQ